MRINSTSTADVLTTLIQEDRAEVRIFRDRAQTVCYTLVLASFAISGFLIGNVHLPPHQLRYMTLMIDLYLVGAMFVLFWRTRHDLAFLRKAMKARQILLNDLHEGELEEVNPFPPAITMKPGITDDDLYWVVGLSAVVVLIKTVAVSLTAASFALPRITP